MLQQPLCSGVASSNHRSSQDKTVTPRDKKACGVPISFSPYMSLSAPPLQVSRRRVIKTPPPKSTTTPHQPRGVGESPRFSLSVPSSASNSLRKASSEPKKNRRCYVVGTMRHCGSIFEEMTRQLLATGRWTRVEVRTQPVMKTLWVPDQKKSLNDVDIHLFLGEKIPAEKVIATRRYAYKRYANSSGRERGVYSIPRSVKMLMGNGDDGEPRVVDFIENTRCITLKNSMVATLLRHHNNDWKSLQAYMPMTFQLISRQPSRDERDRLIETCAPKKRFVGTSPTENEHSLWIAKSSAGSHGDDIRIFSGDRNGTTKLLNFVDDQPHKTMWVVQQYIDRPLLYHKRKFDIRCWALLTKDNYKIYVHDELVMRTSSIAYDRNTATSKSGEGRLAHITNHCVQSEGDLYSKFEEGNELWREHLDGLVRYKGKKLQEKKRKLPHLMKSARSGTSDSTYTENVSSSKLRGGVDGEMCITLRNMILPQIYHIVVDTLLAAKPYIPKDPVPTPTHCFQVFGYDFLIDDSLKVWLLEINGAPGGAERLMPKVMGDTIELAVNPYFPCSLDAAPMEDNGYVQVYP